MIGSILSPGPFEPDFRPILFLLGVMLVVIVAVTVKFYDEIVDKGDWE